MACENAAPRDYRACRTGGQARRGYPRRVAGVGDAVGPYRIEALLGEGGMGQVFRAAHAQTGDVVALKLLRPEFASDEGLIRRLLREARTVEHRHLVGLLDAGEGEGEHYLAPELLRGDEPNAASDVYAFGCLVYACVAGRPPFGGRGLFAIGAGHLDEEPPDPCAARSDAPQGFAEAVGFALRKAPADRPSTATAYARLIAVGARGGSG